MKPEEFEIPVGTSGEIPTIRAQDVLRIGPEPRKATCVICDKEFQLGESHEGTRFSFSVYSKTLEPPIEVNAYDICHKCFLWVPEVAVEALRRVREAGKAANRIRDRNRALLEASTEGLWGGDMPIPSSDSWEPGGDLTCSP